MTFNQFQLFIPRAQLLYVITAGIYLAQRCVNERGVNLYHLPDEGHGFFAEVGYDATIQEAVVLRSFVSSGPLEDYASYIHLPK